MVHSKRLEWVDPVVAAHALQPADAHLFSCGGEHPHSEWSVLGLFQLGGLQIQASGEWDSGGSIKGSGTGLDSLAGFFTSESAKFQAEPGFPFSGGLSGVWNYEAASLMDSRFPKSKGQVGEFVWWGGAILWHHPSNVMTLIWQDTVTKKQLNVVETALLSPAPIPDSTPQFTGGMLSDRTQAAYENSVARLREFVRGGDLFQANIALSWFQRGRLEPFKLFEQMLQLNPGPYNCLIRFGSRDIISNSPELLIRNRDNFLEARPIAGTRRRSTDSKIDAERVGELRTDEKEIREHRMLVDLVRNDLANVSEAGSTWVEEEGIIEEYANVFHRTSSLKSTPRKYADWVAHLRSTFPGPTITGAPKYRAAKRIFDLENRPRGAYTGSAGFVNWNGEATWNILIRTITQTVEGIHLSAGSGIVSESNPQREYLESMGKAKFMHNLVAGTSHALVSKNVGRCSPGVAWKPTVESPVDANVLLIDNEDSFVGNISDYCVMLGATVTTKRNDEKWWENIESFSHVILSPGPGWPEKAGKLLEGLKALPETLPVLGVCLGHQAMAQHFEGKLAVHEEINHGGTSEIYLTPSTIFAGLPMEIMAARYHSIVVTETKEPIRILATLQDGTTMAIGIEGRPWFGLQFHPESMGTPMGIKILRNFLGVHT